MAHVYYYYGVADSKGQTKNMFLLILYTINIHRIGT